MTRMLAEAATSLRYADLPDEVITVAKQCLLDAFGVAVAGSQTPTATIATTVALEDAPTGPCSIIGSARSTSATSAALANGTAMHALDYDDMAVPLCGHPTAPVLPAILALAELSGSAGSAVIAAFVAAYEAECRIGAAVNPGHYDRGFHATATIGTVGAAIGAGHLLGLDTDELEIAIGIAATQSAGLKAMFGTMCKPLHAGRAAASGVLSARLAREGFTSRRDVLATPQGFAAVLADGIDLAELHRAFGAPWHLLANLFKFHAACYFTHAAIEAMLEFRTAGVPVERVDRIELRVPEQHLLVCNIERPTTGLEAKFSLRFAAAQALVSGAADESRFTDDAVADPRVSELIRRVDVVGDRDLDVYDTSVVVLVGDRAWRIDKNTSAAAFVHHPDEQTPPLVAKFHSLTDPVIGAVRADALVDAILTLDTASDVHAAMLLASHVEADSLANSRG